MLKNISIVSLFMFFSGIACYATTGDEMNESIKNISQRIDVLEYKIPLGFEEKLNSQGDNILTKISSMSSQGISEQQKLISQQQTWLTIFGYIFTFIFTIVSILLGSYITWIANKIKLSEVKIKHSEETAKKIETEIESILQGKTDELYQRIQDADTNAIFKRLKKYPEEIENVFSMLATRKISEIYFDFLKESTLKYADAYTRIGSQYKMLMLQHFYAKLLVEEPLFKILKKDLSTLIITLFQEEKNDMYIDIALKFKEDGSNENYLWFLRTIKGAVSSVVITSMDQKFIEANKKLLLEKINEVTAQSE